MAGRSAAPTGSQQSDHSEHSEHSAPAEGAGEISTLAADIEGADMAFLAAALSPDAEAAAAGGAGLGPASDAVAARPARTASMAVPVHPRARSYSTVSLSGLPTDSVGSLMPGMTPPALTHGTASWGASDIVSDGIGVSGRTASISMIMPDYSPLTTGEARMARTHYLRQSDAIGRLTVDKWAGRLAEYLRLFFSHPTIPVEMRVRVRYQPFSGQHTLTYKLKNYGEGDDFSLSFFLPGCYQFETAAHWHHNVKVLLDIYLATAHIAELKGLATFGGVSPFGIQKYEFTPTSFSVIIKRHGTDERVVIDNPANEKGPALVSHSNGMFVINVFVLLTVIKAQGGFSPEGDALFEGYKQHHLNDAGFIMTHAERAAKDASGVLRRCVSAATATGVMAAPAHKRSPSAPPAPAGLRRERASIDGMAGGAGTGFVPGGTEIAPPGEASAVLLSTPPAGGGDEAEGPDAPKRSRRG